MALWFAVFVLVPGGLGAVARAQEEAPMDPVVVTGLAYVAEINEIADETLSETLVASSLLLSRQDELPAEIGDLLRRGRSDQERLAKALRSLGHYDGTVRIDLDGLDLDAPNVRRHVASNPNAPVAVAITVEPGEAYRLQTITVDWQGGVPEDSDSLVADLGLAPGDAATGAAIYAARDELVSRLRNAGHPLAEAEAPDALIDRSNQTMDVRFPMMAGAKAGFGPVSYVGNDQVETALLERAQPIQIGEPYSPKALADLRNELSSLGVFSAVRVREGDTLDDQGRLPITVELSERERRFIGFGARFASDEGFGIDAEWGHRNLFGQAEQLTATASVDRIGSSVGSGIDYSLGLSFAKPAFRRGDQLFFANAAALKESPDAFDRTALLGELGIERRLTPWLSASIGGSVEASTITEDGDTSDFLLFGVPSTLRLDTTDDLLDPTGGWRGALEATPYVDVAIESAPFFRFGGSIARYFDLFGSGRSILATRVGFGATISEETEELPADKRFFSGGGGSVRGFEFQSLSPTNTQGDPRGGRSLLEVGLEWRQRFGENWGGVVFLDGGSAFTTVFPAGIDDLRYAAGAGIRYFTPIGPIRFDIAFPLDRRRGEDTFQFYIGLGQAF
ncbi:MAG: autotransporter assembly complex family protein [Pseudomonadota bacterium]